MNEIVEVTYVGMNQTQFITSCWQLAGLLGLAIVLSCSVYYWFLYRGQ